MVHTNTSIVTVGYFTSLLARTPHVWHLREFGDLDHGYEPDWGWRWHKRLFARSEALVAVSQAVAKHLVPPASMERTAVIYNGVLTEEGFGRMVERRMEQPAAPRDFTFVIAGQVTGPKGQLQAIEALSGLNRRGQPCRLIVAGEGDARYTQACQRAVAELGLTERVEFLGHLDDPYEAFLRSDAALLCSRCEAMGRVTAEAMAAQIPVIGTAAGGTLELIEEGKTGLLYDGTKAGLESCMLRLAADPAWSKTMGQAAFAWSKGNYTIERYGSAVHRVFTRVRRAKKVTA
jgi:glycosyltransferase involved in cell wall biosynthesis